MEFGFLISFQNRKLDWTLLLFLSDILLVVRTFFVHIGKQLRDLILADQIDASCFDITRDFLARLLFDELHKGCIQTWDLVDGNESSSVS